MGATLICMLSSLRKVIFDADPENEHQYGAEDAHPRAEGASCDRHAFAYAIAGSRQPERWAGQGTMIAPTYGIAHSGRWLAGVKAIAEPHQRYQNAFKGWGITHFRMGHAQPNFAIACRFLVSRILKPSSHAQTSCA